MIGTQLAVIAFALGSLVVTGCGSAGLRLAAATPGIALDPQLDKDIHAGAATYGPILTRWGRWEEDEWYAVRWCPNADQIASNGGAHFSPYRTRGHWATNESQSMYGAPAGSPYWMSDDGDTWGDITMHHGWWVHMASSPVHEWCWIPGAEATAGRVVWRSGEGFVGWAPESPVWVDDGGDDTIAALDWSFAFLGSLLELDLSSQILEGDAREGASEATMPVHAVQNSFGGRVTRVGPPSITVHTARAALVAYAGAHGGSLPQRSETPKSASAAAGASNDSESTTKKKKDDEHLPPASGVYSRLSEDSFGPSGMTPRYAPSRPSSPSSYAGSSSSAPSYAHTSGGTSSSGSSSSPASAPSHGASSSSSSSSHTSTHRR
jgi:hypothetical protein